MVGVFIWRFELEVMSGQTLFGIFQAARIRTVKAKRVGGL